MYIAMISEGRIGPEAMTMSDVLAVSEPSVQPHVFTVLVVPTGESWSGSHERPKRRPVMAEMAVIMVVTVMYGFMGSVVYVCEMV